MSIDYQVNLISVSENRNRVDVIINNMAPKQEHVISNVRHKYPGSCAFGAVNGNEFRIWLDKLGSDAWKALAKSQYRGASDNTVNLLIQQTCNPMGYVCDVKVANKRNAARDAILDYAKLEGWATGYNNTNLVLYKSQFINENAHTTLSASHRCSTPFEMITAGGQISHWYNDVSRALTHPCLKLEFDKSNGHMYVYDMMTEKVKTPEDIGLTTLKQLLDTL